MICLFVHSIYCTALRNATYAQCVCRNVIDTASNYRSGCGEESVGRALQALRTVPGLTREMLFISTKAGFMNETLLPDLLHKGRIKQTDVLSGSHCIHPACLEASLERSLKAMNIGTVSWFGQLDTGTPVSEVLSCMRASQASRHLTILDRAGRPAVPPQCGGNAARGGGIALLPQEAGCRLQVPRAEEEAGPDPGVRHGHVDLLPLTARGASISCIAEGGRARRGNRGQRPRLQACSRHLALSTGSALCILLNRTAAQFCWLRYIQLPINAGMLEAAQRPWQPVTSGDETRQYTVLQAAAELGVGVFASGPLGEGRLLTDSGVLVRLARC